MTNTTLTQLGNTVVIMGTIKEKNLEMAQSTYTDKQTGQQVTKDVIRGNVIIEVLDKERGRTHNHKVEVYRFEADNVVYKGLVTAYNEHQVGDFVKVTANVEANDFVDKEGNVVERNKLVGVFFNRVTNEAEQIPCAEAKIKMVIENYLPVNNADGSIKHYQVKGFTVGYNGKIIPLHNVIIGQELGEAIAGFYPVGMNAMGEISFDVNSYLETSVAPVQTASVGFGRQATNVVTTGGKFVNNLEIIGGLPAERQFSQAEMQVVQQSRNLALEDVKRKHAERQANGAGMQKPQTPPTQTLAFGSTGAVSNNGNPFGATEFSEDSLPF